MTDLSTNNLKRLLAETSPGPWEARGNYPDGNARPDDSYQMSDAAGDYLGIMHGQDAYLAALAPELAQEVLRIRRRLNKMVADLEAMDGDPQYLDIEQLFAAFTASNLRSVIGHQNLGDQDG